MILGIMRFGFTFASVLAILGCENGLVAETPASGGRTAAATGGSSATGGSTSSPSVDPPVIGGAGSTATAAGGATAIVIESSGGSAGTAGASPNSAARAFVLYDVNDTGVSRDIHVKSVDGQCERILVGTEAQEKQPTLSPDGRRLAYASNLTGIYQIHVQDLETGLVSVLTEEAQGATHPSWSPDGTQIVFMTGDRETEPSVRGDVKLLDVASRQTRVLFVGTSGICCVGYMSPVFADENLVLVGNGVSLIGIRLASGDWYDVVPMTGRIPNPQDPSPSPDGKLFAFSDYCGGQLQVYIARIDGTTGDTCAAAFPLAKHPSGLVSPSWGWGGLVAAETRDANIVLLQADGTGTAEVFVDVTGPAHNPSFAPLTYVDPECQ